MGNASHTATPPTKINRKAAAKRMLEALTPESGGGEE
jgi:hypothetical protein